MTEKKKAELKGTKTTPKVKKATQTAKYPVKREWEAIEGKWKAVERELKAIEGKRETVEREWEAIEGKWKAKERELVALILGAKGKKTESELLEEVRDAIKAVAICEMSRLLLKVMADFHKGLVG